MTMKPFFVALLLATAVATRAQQVPSVPASAGTMPQDKTQPSPRLNSLVEARAERLSTQMVRDLHLNGYQASRLRDINTDKVAKLDVIERQYAKNPQAVEEQTKLLTKASDQQLQTVLTADQYTDYFDARKRYAQADKDYARSASASILVNSVQNPAPARANDAVISPTKTTTKPNRAAIRQ
jgi:hypothetical protein